MKYLMPTLFSTCLLLSGTALSQTHLLNTLDAAQKNCPAVDSIQFKAGQSTSGPLAAISYLTGTFSAKKNGKSFMNSESDYSCPAGTAKPHAITSAKDANVAKKSGANICLVFPTPMLSADKVVEHVDFFRVNGAYGSINGNSIRCNYKYSGIIDPETSKPLAGLLMLRSR
jgi:hypothetical protein